MKMRFTLNDGYDNLKGLVNCGRSIIDLGADLQDGMIESEDPHVQQTLAELRGKSGRIFTSMLIKSDGTVEPVPLEPIPSKPAERDPAEVAAQLEASQQAGKLPAPPRPLSNPGYDSLPDAELTALIKARGLPVPTDVNHEELVGILDAADAE